jgi:hypothetical protein
MGMVVNIKSIAITQIQSSSDGNDYNILYAISNDSVFKSINNGIDWIILSTYEEIDDSPNPDYNGLPIFINNIDEYIKVLNDLENKNIIYILSKNGKVYRTLDDGETWSTVFNYSEQINDVSIVSNYTNYIFVGTNKNGLKRFDDSIRDFIDVDIDTDGRIIYFNHDQLEAGDRYSTDSNTINLRTHVNNDDAINTQERIKFKIDKDTNFVSFKFKKNNTYFDKTDIHIGELIINPPNNPFVIQNPEEYNDNLTIIKITEINNILFVLTIDGIYTSKNNGQKWNKLITSALPNKTYDIIYDYDNSNYVIGTSNGLWIANKELNEFKYIESKNKDVDVVWNNSYRGTEFLYRGGNDGLYITLKNSKSLVVYSGAKSENSFYWGDIFNLSDGGFSDLTREIFNNPITRSVDTDGTMVDHFGWDYALIVRKGPYLDYNLALEHSKTNNIWSPNVYVGYPLNDRGLDDYNNHTSGPLFSSSEIDQKSLEYLRDQNLGQGSSWLGSIVEGKPCLGDGNIIIGHIKNRRGNPPRTNLEIFYKTNNLEFDSGPTSEFMVTDKVQPILGLSRPDFWISNVHEYNNEYTTKDSPLFNKQKAPELLSNMFYIYKVYPFFLIPDPTVVIGGGGQHIKYPVYPFYYPRSGDTPEAYGYKITIDKFQGSTKIVCGLTLNNNNWVVGTDNGIFYSKNYGMDVFRATGVVGYISNIILTSGGILLASCISDNGYIQLIKCVDGTGNNWIPINEVGSLFDQLRINKIYNFIEYENKIYLATNQGIFIGDINASNWIFNGTVGSVQSLSNGNKLYQSFTVL